jgi:hypothetical protein
MGTGGSCYKIWPPTGASSGAGTPELRPDLVGALWALDNFNSGTGVQDETHVGGQADIDVPFLGFPSTRAPTADAIDYTILNRGQQARWLRAPGLTPRRSGYEMREDANDNSEDIDVPHEIMTRSGTDLTLASNAVSGYDANSPSSEYGIVPSTDSGMVLVVTHMPISEGEVFELSEVVRALNHRQNVNRAAIAAGDSPRGVVIAYFPTYPEDTGDAAINRFARALGIAGSGQPDQGWAGSEFNSLQVFSPRRKDFLSDDLSTNIVYPDITDATQAYKEMKRFWRHMLDPDPASQWSAGFPTGSPSRYVTRNISNYAEFTYFNLLHRYEPKL